ncbi:MAG: hypothetical protein AW07_01799 [Candidatus Accumulibacter sp. SK-11]|nr:MAG: hypothetical protein AW07_01799 [Candidatus Accumulibacter sp. SK-11]
MVTGRQGHAGRREQILRRRLRAHGTDRCCRRTDEGDSGGCTGIGKGVVLRQEAVARVNGLRATACGGLENSLADEVRLTCRRRADAHRFVGQPDMACVGVGLGIDGNGTHPHAAGRPDHAAGDLAAVGNQDPAKHSATSFARPAVCVERGADASSRDDDHRHLNRPASWAAASREKQPGLPFPPRWHERA